MRDLPSQQSRSPACRLHHEECLLGLWVCDTAEEVGSKHGEVTRCMDYLAGSVWTTMAGIFGGSFPSGRLRGNVARLLTDCVGAAVGGELLGGLR